MGKRLTDILPKISQWESIPYAGDLNCPNCDKSGFYNFYGETRENPTLLGGAKPLSVIWLYLNVLSVLKNTDFIVPSALGRQI